MPTLQNRRTEVLSVSLRIAGRALGICLAMAAVGASASSAPVAPASYPTGASAHATTVANPMWTQLTPAQQQTLAPLAQEWNQLEPVRKAKWLTIANKYTSMKPDEQQRVQERMREWVKLTPNQRHQARENYARAKKLNPDEKSAKWEEYQRLPDDKKKELAESAAAKKRVATLPSPMSQAKSSKTIPPIKSAPKPLLEQSVTPQAVNQSAIQPVSQPSVQPSK